jgi:hypothetical protein
MSECSCDLCKSECTRMPGWFSPAEARRAIDAGLASRLSSVRQGEVVALAPSRVGMEGRETDFGGGRCTFYRNDGYCEIHDTDFKPIECVTGFGCSKGNCISLASMFKMWQSGIGRRSVTAWRKAIGR